MSIEEPAQARTSVPYKLIIYMASSSNTLPHAQLPLGCLWHVAHTPEQTTEVSYLFDPHLQIEPVTSTQRTPEQGLRRQTETRSLPSLLARRGNARTAVD